MLGVVFIRRLALETLAALLGAGAHAKVTHVWTFRDERNPI